MCHTEIVVKYGRLYVDSDVDRTNFAILNHLLEIVLVKHEFASIYDFEHFYLLNRGELTSCLHPVFRHWVFWGGGSDELVCIFLLLA